MKKIVLISCCKEKLKHRAEAGKMYTGDLFTKSLTYARVKLHPDKIFILSAKYGLLRMDDAIEHYDVTLNNIGKAARRQWADKVLQQLKSHSDLDKDYFVFLAGEKYREFLISNIVNHSIPMKGLKIGEQKAWLNRHIV